MDVIQTKLTFLFKNSLYCYFVGLDEIFILIIMQTDFPNIMILLVQLRDWLSRLYLLISPLYWKSK